MPARRSAADVPVQRHRRAVAQRQPVQHRHHRAGDQHRVHTQRHPVQRPVALAADPTYGPAAYALVAARVAERDGVAAEKALARAPAADTDDAKRERAVLEAAAAWARNDPARAKTLLTGPAGVAAEGTDPVAPLARALLVLGYRRATLTVLSGETRDPARLALRVRAYAALKDADAVKAELARLREVDPTTAADLAKRDPLVASVASR